MSRTRRPVRNRPALGKGGQVRVGAVPAAVEASSATRHAAPAEPRTRPARFRRVLLGVVLALEVVAVASAIGVVAYLEFWPSAAPATATVPRAAWPVATRERTVPPPPVTRVTLLAVGDLMTHSPQFPAARRPDGSYDFAPCFAEVAPYVSAADVAIGNLETVLGGAALGYSGFPRFNAPDAFAEALAAAGFDVLTTANNHCLDQGPAAADRTLEVLDRLGIRHTGTARTKGEADSLLVVDVDGVKVAIIAYTYSLNGFRPPADRPWMVNQIDKAAMVADVRAAEEAGADVIVASVHNGIEYARQPSEGQWRLERALVDAGADVVLGSHPHVIQPMETIEVQRSDGTTETAFVIHSLGNFISNQRDRYCDAGVMVKLTFEKDLAARLTRLVAVEYMPTWVDVTAAGGRRYRVLPVGVDGQATYADVSAEDRAKMARTWADTTAHLGGIGPSPVEPRAVVFYRAPALTRP